MDPFCIIVAEINKTKESKTADGMFRLQGDNGGGRFLFDLDFYAHSRKEIIKSWHYAFSRPGVACPQIC